MLAVEKVNWHHELPQGVFGPNGTHKIPGIDQDFIDQADNGHIFRRPDHYKTGGIHFPDENGKPLNDQWKDWIDEHKRKNSGALPTKDDILKHRDELRVKYKDIYTKGKKPKVSHKAWLKLKKEAVDKIRKELIDKAKKKAADIVKNKVKKGGKLAAKKGAKMIPGVGTVVAIFVFGGEVYAGRPVGEAFVDNALDAIPVVGTVKGAYEIGDAAVELGGAFLGEVEVTEDEIEDRLWEDADTFEEPAVEIEEEQAIPSQAQIHN